MLKSEFLVRFDYFERINQKLSLGDFKPENIEDYLESINNFLNSLGVNENTMNTVEEISQYIVAVVKLIFQGWNTFVEILQKQTNKKIYLAGFQKGYDLLCEVVPATKEEKETLELAKQSYMQTIRELGA